MPSRFTWTLASWEDYQYWQGQDRKTLKRINNLIKGCLREPFDGIGKPEPLKKISPAFGRAASMKPTAWSIGSTATIWLLLPAAITTTDQRQFEEINLIRAPLIRTIKPEGSQTLPCF